ncbi:MAG: YbaB/EbfC family nucleoid-associated protein [Candidatus Omnitrophica bacterium]|nr:YbaB/EbfC family nucleoid-associated protein [Candidatus Omnitrophota bacterium]
MFDKMKMLMEAKKKVEEIKKELENTVFEIASSDGLVKVTMNGSQEIKDVEVQGNVSDNKALEDAIKDALNRAVKHSHDIAAQKMKDITGLNIPGLF